MGGSVWVRTACSSAAGSTTAASEGGQGSGEADLVIVDVLAVLGPARDDDGATAEGAGLQEGRRSGVQHDDAGGLQEGVEGLGRQRVDDLCVGGGRGGGAALEGDGLAELDREAVGGEDQAGEGLVVGAEGDEDHRTGPIRIPEG